ncbi:hypothetical protein RJ641_012947 [Dillenia turbinata]|uniref:DUF7733 domain-containing protein n=1 Tax=Dillenia turbinata TaxID=194707 RepID=A0AAN8Z4K3_9MAGN
MRYKTKVEIRSTESYSFHGPKPNSNFCEEGKAISSRQVENYKGIQVEKENLRDDHAVHSAVPHLFLLSFQILTENIISILSIFSAPVRALVPMLYTVRRLFVILDWMHDVWQKKTLPANAELKDVAWFWFGRGLEAANLIYFVINLFVFLIPQFLPNAFEKHLRERDEQHAKSSKDRRSAACDNKPVDKKAD